MRPWLARVVLVLAFAAGNTHAYEEDVHYGLTYWLALQAGFAHDEAQTIATANVRYDHSRARATYVVVRYACVQRDAQMAATVRDNHFPSTGEVPGPLDERTVHAGSAAAFARVDKLLNDLPRVLTGAQRRDLLVAYGEGLHAAQDSWSHHGTPDAPPGGLFGTAVCDPRLSYGHPVTRGGWREHIADLTSRHHPHEAVEMARQTHWQLCALKQRLDGQACVTDADALSLAVEGLAVRRTKQAKAEWFRAHGVQDTAFLDVINEPPGDGYINASIVDGRTRIGSLDVPFSRLQAAAKDPLRFMQDFYTAFTTREVSETTRKLAPRSFARGQLLPGREDNLTDEHREALITFWRVREHGEAVARLGTHDVSTLSVGQVREILPWLRAAAVTHARAEEALLPLDSSGAGVWAEEVRIDGRLVWLGLARLRHAPSEVLAVAAERIDGEFRVVGLDSFVDR